LTAVGDRRKKFIVNSIAGRWVLAGKDSFNRWRGWRDSGAVLLDWGYGCFQSLLWSFTVRKDKGGKGMVKF